MNVSVADTGKEIVLYLTTTLLSLTVHEFAHAFVADKLGDDTPRRQGRLTLSPLAHYDVLGTFVIPIVAIVAGGIPFVAWARPVETNPGNYRRTLSMRNGHRLVSAAGPLSNLLLAIVSMAILTALAHSDGSFGQAQGTVEALAFLLKAMVQVNIGLCVFNFLPIPPLDGSRLLPRSLDDFQASIAPYSFFIIMIILNVPVLRGVFYWPIGMLGAALQSLFGVYVGLA